MLRAIFAGLVLLAAAPGLAQGEHPANNRKVIITDVRISGVRSIGTTDLEQITGQLTGKPINGDESEISDRLRFAFQDSGYFAAEVKDVRVKVSDGLSNPKPVVVEADVKEGPLFHIGEISFANNHAISSEDLKLHFPLHKGEVFQRMKIAQGLEGTRVQYGKLGYLYLTTIPNVDTTADSVNLVVDIEEGPQFRMGNVEFAGSSFLAQQLRSGWKMEAGQPYDETYLAKFLNEYHSQLPSSFNEQVDIDKGIDCKEHVVNLLFKLDPQRRSRPPQDIPCETLKAPEKP